MREFDKIAVSSRVRLARNIAGRPFPGKGAVADEADMVLDILKTLGESAGGKAFEPVPLDDGRKVVSLVERHIISPNFARLSRPHALAVCESDRVSVMIGEEDHLRIQAFADGLDIRGCLDRAKRADILIGESFAYARDEKVGYITACPTNLGTGMRASVMLHLPALTAAGELRGIIAAAETFGLTVRGAYGEGSSAAGDMYQFSNRGGHGADEQTIIRRIENFAELTADAETRARKRKVFVYGGGIFQYV